MSERIRICPPETVEYSCDILILGGGLPGVCAAISAARDGNLVILVERRFTLGGNCGPEVGVHPSDGHRFHPYMCSTGVVGRLIEDAAYLHAKTDADDYHYNISMRWDTVMARALKDAGVTVLRSHYAHTPYMQGNKIVAVECEDTCTYKRVLIHVDGYVIDDSGDGNVSERAGASYRMGREARSEYNERLAPETADSTTMGTSLVTLIRNTGRKSPFYPDRDTPDFFPGYGGDCLIEPKEGDKLQFFFPTETGGNMDVVNDGLKVYDKLRGHIDSAWNEAKNVKGKGTMDNWEMVWQSAQPAKRESRRFIGDYVMTENDVENGRIFEDAIAVGGFGGDIHHPNEENRDYIIIRYMFIPPVYTIPYRSIYSKDVSNLFFASRLLSATHIAHGTVRLQRTLATIGQAAGTAAALCKKHGITPRELYEQGYVKELQQTLIREDATIPGIYNEDKDDKMKLAILTASSEKKQENLGKLRYIPLHGVFGSEIWDFEQKISGGSIVLKNTGGEKKISVTLSRFAPLHPYQDHGERPFFPFYPLHNEAEWGSEHRIRFWKELQTVSITVPPRFEGRLALPFRLDLECPKDILNDDDRLLVTVQGEDEEVFLGISENDVPSSYSRAVAGIKEGIDESEIYTRAYNAEANMEARSEKRYIVLPNAAAITLLPKPLYGEAEQVRKGDNRRFCENPHNMWIPEALPATLTMTWDAPIQARKMHITFDTLTRAAHDMPYESRRRASPRTVKGYTLRFYCKDKLICEKTETEAYHRFHVLPLDLTFDRAELTITEMWEKGELPGVYEIRIY